VQLNSLDDVLHEQIEDLYSAEQQLIKALPEMASAASSTELREAFEHHLEETRGHVTRLQEILGQIGISSPTEHCKGMEGLIAEGNEIVKMQGNSAAKDAALIAAAQRVEHYEIAAYGTAIAHAKLIGQNAIVTLLEESLQEEKAANEKLTEVAESIVNPSAFASEDEDESDSSGEMASAGRSTTSMRASSKPNGRGKNR
jgi:ferritin-like metal-binding protein YciE